MRSSLIAASLWVVAAAPATALAEEPDATESIAVEQRSGVVFGAGYLGEIFANVSGGNRQEVEYLDKVNLTLALDGDKLLGWKGLSLFAYGMGSQGGSPSVNAGDAQGVSNIEAPNTWKLYELWLDYAPFEDRLSMRAGLYDLNSEFDAIETAGLFVNSSHGIGPDFSQAGRNGPSIFPTTSLALRVSGRPLPTLYLQAAVLDGVPGDPDDPNGTHVRFREDDGLLMVAEVGYTTEGPRRGKVALGTWRYTEYFEDVMEVDATGDPVLRKGNKGVYALTDWSVYREPASAEQGLALYLRYGLADADVNAFSQYLGAGAVYVGLIPGRDSDAFGIAAATAITGKKFRSASGADRAELALELSYKAELAPWLWLQPDAQYIVNPSTDPSLTNAFMFAFRLEMAVEAEPG